MEKKIFTLLNDLVFKCVFGQKKHEKLVISLLNAILNREKKNRILSLEFLNPYNLQELKNQKFSIVDVRAKDEQGNLFNIEVQVQPYPGFINRSVYYLAKLYSNQITIGQSYSGLNSATGISILDYNIFPEQKIHSKFCFKNIDGRMILENTMDLHFIELKKLNKVKPGKIGTNFERWLHLMKFGQEYIKMKKRPENLFSEECFKMAIDQLEKINSDAEMRQLLEAREKEQIDAQLIKGGFYKQGLKHGFKRGHEEGLEEGIKEGLEKGLKEGIEQVAKELLNNDVNIEVILKTTGLTKEELEKLK